jgi:hypothetical protein
MEAGLTKKTQCQACNLVQNTVLGRIHTFNPLLCSLRTAGVDDKSTAAFKSLSAME